MMIRRGRSLLGPEQGRVLDSIVASRLKMQFKRRYHSVQLSDASISIITWEKLRAGREIVVWPGVLTSLEAKMCVLCGLDTFCESLLRTKWRIKIKSSSLLWPALDELDRSRSEGARFTGFVAYASLEIPDLRRTKAYFCSL